jgi:uncharacterized membrane protein (DUF4010 family)
MTDASSMSFLHRIEIWPFVDMLAKMGLAATVGTLVGLEREHYGKAGVRTFALTALLGSMGGLLGGPYGPIAMLFVAMFISLMNLREMVKERKLALTTSVALTTVGFAGVMCGLGHVFTPVAACIITTAFLSCKEPIAGFAEKVSTEEIRSAILLAILACIVYPALPEHPIDPWGLINPRGNWVAVIAIATIGFINYILLKLLGPKGMEITAFFGGLVNSRKVIVELMSRTREAGPEIRSTAEKGVVLATASVAIRNGLIVGIFAFKALPLCAAPLLLMLVSSALLWWRAAKRPELGAPPSLKLESPFSLTAALKFGLVFLALNVAGGLAEHHLGAASFYVVSALGGLISSASSITSAATLIGSGHIPAKTGANGIILSTIVSVLANIPLIRAMTSDKSLRSAAVFDLLVVAGSAILGVGLTYLAMHLLTVN